MESVLKNKVKDIIRRDLVFSVPNERTFLYRHLSAYAKTLKDKIILDVGAGHQQYRTLFDQFNKYEACDLEAGFHAEKKPDFFASVYEIPRNNETYDVVLMLQVLEHLEYPLKGLTEVHRILKKGGSLYLSTPQAAGDHFEPYHFYNFTQYGLKSLLAQAGFKVIEHQRLAGMFHYVGNRIHKLGGSLYYQYRSEKNYVAAALAFVFKALCYVLARILSLFNFLDKRKHYCIGHIVVAQKTGD